MIKDDEFITKVNYDLELIQKKEGLTLGTDAYLLHAYMRKMKSAVAVDFGCGTGIISLLSKDKFKKIICVDIQAEFCDIAKRNAENNHIDNIEVIHGDIRDLKLNADVVFTNPPYMKTDEGKANCSDIKNTARHECNGDINDFVAAAARCLKFGGLFYCVYRASRLCDLIYAMKNSDIEPKRMTLVYATKNHEPSIVLCEGKKGSKPSVYITPPLLISEKGVNTNEYNEIYESGEFGERYFKR